MHATIEAPTPETTTLPEGPAAGRPASKARPRSGLRTLVGAGDRIGMFTLPFLAIGVAMHVRNPARFAVGRPAIALQAIAAAVLACGVALWAWSVALILAKVPRGELITTGPFALVKHPLYTSVALLVLPAAGYLRRTWLGALAGVVLYAGSRLYAPAEEEALSRTFGERWEAYRRSVRLRWL